MSEDWCQERLQNLKIEDRRNDTLNELKSQLSGLGEAEDGILDEVLNSSSLFDCLNDRENSPLACDVLTICMNNMSLEKTIKNTALLERILRHEKPNVRVLGINEVARILRHTPNGFVDLSIVIALIDCLKIETGSSCIPLLAKILPAFIENNAVRTNLDATLNLDTTIRCRTFEIGVLLARESPELLDQVQFIIQRLLAEIDSSDILLQLNVLELLSEIPAKEHGLVYLENTGVFTNLLRKIETIADNPLSELLIPGLIKFFGNVGSIHPGKVLNEYSYVVNSLFDCIKSNDYALLPTALDTLGYLGRSSEGKRCFDTKFGQQMKEILHGIGVGIKNLPTELKIRTLNCISNLLHVEATEDNNQISVITESWYEVLPNGDNLQFIMLYAKNPFPDIKSSAFALLRAVIHHKWGQKKLQLTGGFIEFLLDRASEFNKDLIQAKYEIIRMLSKSTVFDAATLVQLKKYVTEGAFYVHGITEVAIEGAS